MAPRHGRRSEASRHAGRLRAAESRQRSICRPFGRRWRGEEVGPLVKLQAMWRQPYPSRRRSTDRGAASGRVRRCDPTSRCRKKVEPRFITYGGRHRYGWQHCDMEEYRHTRRIAESSIPGSCRWGETQFNQEGGGAEGIMRSAQARHLVKMKPATDLAVRRPARTLRSAWARFCSVFPDMFYKERAAKTIRRVEMKAAI